MLCYAKTHSLERFVIWFIAWAKRLLRRYSDAIKLNIPQDTTSKNMKSVGTQQEGDISDKIKISDAVSDMQPSSVQVKTRSLTAGNILNNQPQQRVEKMFTGQRQVSYRKQQHFIIRDSKNIQSNRKHANDSPGIGRKRSHDSSAYGADDDLYEVILNINQTNKVLSNHDRKLLTSSAAYLSGLTDSTNNRDSASKHQIDKLNRNVKKRNRKLLPSLVIPDSSNSTDNQLKIKQDLNEDCKGSCNTLLINEEDASQAFNDNENVSSSATPISYKPRASLSNVLGLLGEQVWKIFSPQHGYCSSNDDFSE